MIGSIGVTKANDYNILFGIQIEKLAVKTNGKIAAIFHGTQTPIVIVVMFVAATGIRCGGICDPLFGNNLLAVPISVI